MGRVRQPERVKLFFGLIGRPDVLEVGRRAIAERFGLEETVSPVWDFDHTDYYRQEFGEGLKRQFLAAKELIRAEQLVEIKLATNGLEQDLALAGARRLNIDPGYLADSKVVLATTKDYGHRLYLGRGIYGEVTLKFREGEYRSLEHTYPDYRTPEYRRFFGELRRSFLSASNESG